MPLQRKWVRGRFLEPYSTDSKTILEGASLAACSGFDFYKEGEHLNNMARTNAPLDRHLIRESLLRMERYHDALGQAISMVNEGLGESHVVPHTASVQEE